MVSGSDTHISLFNINLYDAGEGKSKLTNCISVEDKVDVNKSLGDIRDILVQEKKLDSGKAGLTFCTKDGAQVPDTTRFRVYQLLTAPDKAPAIEPKAKETENENVIPKDGKTVAPASATELSTVDNSVTKYDLYFEKREKTSRTNAISDHAKKLLDGELDLDLAKNKPELLKATLKELSSIYDHKNFKAATGGDVVTAGSMSEDDWALVLRNTNFLSGQRIVFSRNANGSRTFQRLDKAPFAAFTLKPRQISHVEKASKGIDVKQVFEIPHYAVTDDSYVNVFETASALSNSVASSDFSQTDVEISAGGGLFGASLSVKGGFSNSESSAMAKSSSSSTRSMNITYNFPRVVLLLEEPTLELTESCKKAIEGIKDEESLMKFHNDYGHFFARNVELGGKLLASEQFSSSESADSTEKANAMKYKASLSFSAGSFFQASASYGHEKQHNESVQNQSSHMQKTLSWEARGGDTILCNDPPNWCPTVKPFANWRIVNQRDVVPMADFIGQFEQGKEVQQKIKQIRDDSRKVVDCKFRLRAKVQAGIPKDEFYGLRKDDKKRLEKVLETYAADLRKDKSGEAKTKVDKHIKDLTERMSNSDFSVNWTEHVGIHHYDASCIFEIKVETILNEHPELQLGVPYKLYNKHRNSWLIADTKGTYHEEHRYFGYLFYGREDRASKFMFNAPNARTLRGGIYHGMVVELVLCDEEDQPAAVVQRFVHDETTLLVSKYGDNVTNDHTIAHPAVLEYV